MLQMIPTEVAYYTVGRGSPAGTNYSIINTIRHFRHESLYVYSFKYLFEIDYYNKGLLVSLKKTGQKRESTGWDPQHPDPGPLLFHHFLPLWHQVCHSSSPLLHLPSHPPFLHPLLPLPSPSHLGQQGSIPHSFPLLPSTPTHLGNQLVI